MTCRILILLVAALALGLGTPANGADTQKLKAAYRKAAALAKSGNTAGSVKILAALIKRQPRWTPPRVLLARILHGAGKSEAAAKQAQAILELDPDNTVAQAILARGGATASRPEAPPSDDPPETADPPATVFMSGGPATYSAWDRIWRIPGDKSFGLNEFQGGEGHTLYHFPDRKDDPDNWSRYEVDAQDNALYFLREVDVITDAGQPDLTLAAAQEHQVTSVPFMILVDPDGNETARGSPEQIESALETVRAAAQKAQETPPSAGPAKISSSDFSTSTAAIESLGTRGWQTVVMITSPG